MKYKPYLTGFLAGIFSGLLGVGGGVVLIPLLVKWLGVEQKKAQGTSLFFICPIALIGSAQYYFLGNLNLTNLIWIAAGSMLGIYWGSFFAYKLKSAFLNKAFAVIMILVSLKLFWGP